MLEQNSKIHTHLEIFNAISAFFCNQNFVFGDQNTFLYINQWILMFIGMEEVYHFWSDWGLHLYAKKKCKISDLIWVYTCMQYKMYDLDWSHNRSHLIIEPISCWKAKNKDLAELS